MFEITFVHPETSEELYVGIGEESGRIGSLYTDRGGEWLDGRIRAGAAYSAALNPLFLHAADADEEFRAALEEGFIHGSDPDLITLERAKEIAAGWHASGNAYSILSHTGRIDYPRLAEEIERDLPYWRERADHADEDEEIRELEALLLFVRVFGPSAHVPCVGA